MYFWYKANNPKTLHCCSLSVKFADKCQNMSYENIREENVQIVIKNVITDRKHCKQIIISFQIMFWLIQFFNKKILRLDFTDCTFLRPKLHPRGVNYYNYQEKMRYSYLTFNFDFYLTYYVCSTGSPNSNCTILGAYFPSSQ